METFRSQTEKVLALHTHTHTHTERERERERELYYELSITGV